MTEPNKLKYIISAAPEREAVDKQISYDTAVQIQWSVAVFLFGFVCTLAWKYVTSYFILKSDFELYTKEVTKKLDEVNKEINNLNNELKTQAAINTINYESLEKSLSVIASALETKAKMESELNNRANVQLSKELLEIRKFLSILSKKA